MPRFSGQSILREINYFQRYSLLLFRASIQSPFLRNILDKLARKGKKINRVVRKTRYDFTKFVRFQLDAISIHSDAYYFSLGYASR